MARERDTGVNDTGQNRTIRQRESLGNAYAALVGQQSIQSWTAFTLEEALDAQIERIEGASTTRRPNELERVDQIEQETVAAIAALRDTPPEQFLEASEDQDVNTARTADD